MNQKLHVTKNIKSLQNQPLLSSPDVHDQDIKNRKTFDEIEEDKSSIVTNRDKNRQGSAMMETASPPMPTKNKAKAL